MTSERAVEPREDERQRLDEANAFGYREGYRAALAAARGEPGLRDVASLKDAQRHMVHAHTFCSQCVKHAANLDDLAAALATPATPEPDQ